MPGTPHPCRWPRDDTGYLIPTLIKEDKSCLDIISAAIQETLLATGNVGAVDCLEHLTPAGGLVGAHQLDRVVGVLVDVRFVGVV